MGSPVPTAGPLARLRVLDLTQFLSGPFATQILGDLGAEVIKIEAPEGDLTRTLPPHFVGNDSAYYLCANRNKRSVAVNLKTQEGQDIVRRLVLASDIVVENFRPGVAQRLGLGYDRLAAEHPGLIWCSISGFGQDGPYRDRPAYDMIVQALSGGMSLTGDPAGEPVRSGIPLADLAAGMYGVIGLLAAVEARRHTKLGRFVDISMLDCQIAMLSYQAAYCLASGESPSRQGRGHDSIPTYRAFTCRDGIDVVITANTEKMWRGLCGVLELQHLATEPRFVTNDQRHQHRNELWPILECAFKRLPSDAWVEKLHSAEIPAAVVNDLNRALSDPQVLHRGMVLEMRNANGEPARVAGNPIKYRGKPEMPPAYPPALNADGSTVLSDVLGIGVAEIDRLTSKGIIGGRSAVAAVSSQGQGGAS